MRFLTTIFLTLCFYSVSAQDADLDLLRSWMVGSFDTKAQAASDTSYLEIDLHMAEIWKNSDEDMWLYVEQAASVSPERPYRQRVYQVKELGPNQFISYVYEIPDKTTWVGSWKKPKKFKTIKKEDLSLLKGCGISLLYNEGVFIGSMEELCPNDWQGAKFASSEVTITEDKLVSWDRGWDAEGNQVWGAEKGGYVFVKK